MTEKELINAFEEINADEAVKSEICEKLLSRCKKAKLIRKPIPIMITAAALSVVLCATPVVAEGIRSLLVVKYPDTAIIQENIQKSVYESSDGHIKMTVDELLSDEMTVLMTVSYEALDENGREWLESHNFNADIDNIYRITHSDMYGFGIVPDMDGNTIIHGVNFSYGTEELIDYRTENKRCFLLYYEASSRDYDSAEGKFVYPMTNGAETFFIDTKGNVQVETIALESEEVPSAYFTPTHIELSKLSFVIYAMQHGVYETTDEPGNYGGKWLLTVEEYNKISCFLIMSDGEKIRLEGGMNAVYPDEKNNYSDLVLLSGRIPENIDAERITGLEINGVVYKFN